MASVSTYLNFPNYTEEAFDFYETVFKTEFNGNGIMRFKDIPPHDGVPPRRDEIKNLVMHVELPITGGHVLMGTDAPEHMGFKVSFGNNLCINLQPDSRGKTRRLFDALSEGFEITLEVARINMVFNGCLIVQQNNFNQNRNQQ